ncbi:nitroreductase family protein [Proteus myxofaciens]|uniref:Nitroreductase family protein n=1 Tax=Proteus myxofaciens ATCC 19692 TaxID=1354337 RepID=A0A198FN26_9GAMM|nr:nitroreductase family protein [Proteus myxofaciens]OAT25864.1 nitroreductase family protein [Proteus myxofaciens ATCC 19692]
MSNAFTDLMKKRRTIYNLGNQLPISEDRVTAIIKEAVKESPTAFNSQTSRVVILFGEQHKKLWEITKNTLKKLVPAEAFSATEAKINSFAAGAGSILYFEDTDIVKGLQEQFPLYADNFPIWSEQASGMAQLSVWTALAAENVGASLQHYNPIIDDEVHSTWDIPKTWKLRAQMIFGSIEQEAGEKNYMEDESRFRVYK